MKKFLALYSGNQATRDGMKEATPEEMKANMDAWMAWKAKNEAAIVDFGMPLEMGKSLMTNTTTDSKMMIGGYSILQGETMEDVRKALDGNPHFMMGGENSVEVFEFMQMPGM